MQEWVQRQNRMRHVVQDWVQRQDRMCRFLAKGAEPKTYEHTCGASLLVTRTPLIPRTSHRQPAFFLATGKDRRSKHTSEQMLASKTLRYGRLPLADGPRQQARDSSNKLTHKVTRCHHLGLLHPHASLESGVPSFSRRRRPRQPSARTSAALFRGAPACAPSIGRGCGGSGCAIPG